MAESEGDRRAPRRGVGSLGGGHEAPAPCELSIKLLLVCSNIDEEESPPCRGASWSAFVCAMCPLRFHLLPRNRNVHGRRSSVLLPSHPANLCCRTLHSNTTLLYHITANTDTNSGTPAPTLAARLVAAPASA
eukprot:scaffold79504_cov27-Tisochrysis_lutea.AAC.1